MEACATTRLTRDRFSVMPEDIQCSIVFYLTTLHALDKFFKEALPDRRKLQSCVTWIEPDPFNKIIRYDRVLPYINLEILGVPVYFDSGIEALASLPHLREITFCSKGGHTDYVLEPYTRALTSQQLSNLHLFIKFCPGLIPGKEWWIPKQFQTVNIYYSFDPLERTYPVMDDPIGEFLIQRKGLILEWTGEFSRFTYGEKSGNPTLYMNGPERQVRRKEVKSIDYTFSFPDSNSVYEDIYGTIIKEITLPSISWSYIRRSRSDQYDDLVISPVEWDTDLGFNINQHHNATEWYVRPELPINEYYYQLAKGISNSFNNIYLNHNPNMKSLHFPIHADIINNALGPFPNLLYLQVLIDDRKSIPILYKLQSKLRYFTIFTTIDDIPSIPNAEIVMIP